MSSITLVTKSKTTCDVLIAQLNDLLGDKVSINSYYIEGNMKRGISDDLIVVSSIDIYGSVKEYISPDCPVIIARRSINYDSIDKLFDIPEGTSVLLVNDLESTTYEAISFLKTLGIDHIKYVPFYPGLKEYPRLKLAVTIGEPSLVPPHAEEIIDIKIRAIDFTTMVEITRALGLFDEKAYLLSARYIRDIISLIKKTKYMSDINSRMKNQLQTIINTAHDGILAIDENDNVSVFNPVAEDIFEISSDEIIGKGINSGLINKELLGSFGEIMEGQAFLKVKDRHVVINTSLIKENHCSMGRVYTIKDVTEIQRLEEELRRKLIAEQNFAKYTFIENTEENIFWDIMGQMLYPIFIYVQLNYMGINM